MPRHFKPVQFKKVRSTTGALPPRHVRRAPRHVRRAPKHQKSVHHVKKVVVKAKKAPVKHHKKISHKKSVPKNKNKVEFIDEDPNQFGA